MPSPSQPPPGRSGACSSPGSGSHAVGTRSLSSVSRRGASVGWSWAASGLLVLAVVAAGAVLAGCGSSEVGLNEDPAAYADEVESLKDRLSQNSSDAQALRDLGAIYVRTGRPTQAYDRLKKAYSQVPTDPKTMFFLGLASERVGKEAAAKKLFQRFDQVPQSSKYHRLMRGRYEWMVRQDARESIRSLVAQERELETDRVVARAVAVMPLRYNGTNDRYRPIGRGLAEMMTTDLANVDRLQVVERVRLQALLDELKLAQSQYVDPSTAPQVGKLLGAGRLVGGSYYVTRSEELRLNLNVADVSGGGAVQDVSSESGSLDDLFRLQTKLVFDLVDAFGVELTPREREAIEQVPTRDLQAFLAYSRGLLEEDRGNFSAAARQFRRAQEIDPSFQKAASDAERAAGLSDAGGPPQNAIASAEPPAGPSPSERLMNRRIQNMMGGSGLFPGADRTNPFPEQVNTLEDALRLPPAPPEPPQ